MQVAQPHAVIWFSRVGAYVVLTQKQKTKKKQKSQKSKHLAVDARCRRCCRPPSLSPSMCGVRLSRAHAIRAEREELAEPASAEPIAPTPSYRHHRVRVGPRSFHRRWIRARLGGGQPPSPNPSGRWHHRARASPATEPPAATHYRVVAAALEWERGGMRNERERERGGVNEGEEVGEEGR